MQVNIKNFLFLFLLTFSFTTSADVHKWKDANGKTHYGDAPPIANTEKVKTDKQTDDQITYGEKLRAENANNEATEAKSQAMNEAMNEGVAAAKESGKCVFSYHTLGDNKGKQLAKAAREECYKNEGLKKAGQNSQVSLEAYNMWRDHHQMMSNRRDASVQRSQNAQMQNQINQIQNRQRGLGY